MKKSNSKPIFILQCYEDREPTFPLKKVQTPQKANGIKSDTINGSPPPPPPMPKENGNHVNGSDNGIDAGIDVKSEAQRLSKKESKITNGKNTSIKRIPTPDYETSNIDTLTAKLKLKSKEEIAELESLESYKLRNPSSQVVKPPSTYFTRPPNGTATMKKNLRPVSVTIGEYPNGAIRKEPSKLDFLNVETKNNGLDVNDNIPIGSRLQSELVMTLSKSNLRRKTEHERMLVDKSALDNGNSEEESDQSIDKNFHKRYGNNMLPTPPPVSIPKVPGIKSSSPKNQLDIVPSKINGICHNGLMKDVASCNNEIEKKISFNHVLTMVGDKK